MQLKAIFIIFIRMVFFPLYYSKKEQRMFIKINIACYGFLKKLRNSITYINDQKIKYLENVINNPTLSPSEKITNVCSQQINNCAI